MCVAQLMQHCDMKVKIWRLMYWTCIARLKVTSLLKFSSRYISIKPRIKCTSTMKENNNCRSSFRIGGCSRSKGTIQV
jgi:hypothetical protein